MGQRLRVVEETPDAYDDAWIHLRRRERRALAALYAMLASFAAVALLALVGKLLGPSVLLTALMLSIVATVPIAGCFCVWNLFGVFYFRCPRCGRFFNLSWWGDVPGSYCPHCKLHRFEAAEPKRVVLDHD